MNNNNKTQQIYPEYIDDEPIPQRCALHIRRLDKIEDRVDLIESRMTIVEDMRKTLSSLDKKVGIIDERVMSISWPLRIIAGSVIVTIVGAILALIIKAI
jgi:hypothetical protein